MFPLDRILNLPIDCLEYALAPVVAIAVPYPVVIEERVEELLPLVLRHVVYVVAAVEDRVEQPIVVALFVHEQREQELNNVSDLPQTIDVQDSFGRINFGQRVTQDCP